MAQQAIREREGKAREFSSRQLEKAAGQWANLGVLAALRGFWSCFAGGLLENLRLGKLEVAKPDPFMVQNLF